MDWQASAVTFAMWNEEFADRTLPPTDRRRRDARQRGEIARSADVTSALLLVAASCLIWFLAMAAIDRFVGLLQAAIKAPVESITIPGAVEVISSACRSAAEILGPIFLVSILAALLGNFVQSGWIWAPARLVPRFRVRSLISWDSATSGMLFTLKLAVLAFVATRFVMTRDRQLHEIGHGEPVTLLANPARFIGELSVQLALCLLVLAIIDYGFQFWRHEQRLKMTVEERRREQLEDSLNPQIRKRRSERAR